MRVRSLSIAGVACLLMLSLAVGCSPAPTGNDGATSTTPETVAPEDSTQPSGGAGVTTGTKGAPSTLGSWKVTVRQTEIGSGNDDVQVEAGKTRLTIEVDLENTSGESLAVASQDWALVDAADASYPVLTSTRPEKQGERTIPAGQSEDVSVNFAVPSAGGPFMLRFTPSQGADGTLEVPVSDEAAATTPKTEDKPEDAPSTGYGY